MSERIRGSYDDALYKSTYTLLYFTLVGLRCDWVSQFHFHVSITNEHFPVTVNFDL